MPTVIAVHHPRAVSRIQARRVLQRHYEELRRRYAPEEP